MSATIEKPTKFTMQTLHKFPDGKHADPQTPNLYLNVRNGGTSRTWLFRGMRHRKSVEVSLGSVRLVTLAEARIKTADIRAGDFVAPKTKAKAEPVKAITFRDDAMSYYDRRRVDWVPAHASGWLSMFTRWVFPIIGDTETHKLKSADLVAVLTQPVVVKGSSESKPLWEAHYRTAFKIHLWMSGIIDRAIRLDDEESPRFTRANPAGKVLEILHPLDVAPIKHPSVAWRDAPALYKQLGAMDCQTARALQLIMLSGVRSAEIIGAKWSEITFAEDLEAGSDYGAVWHIPAERMKSGVARDIPLSSAMVRILRGLTSDRSGFIFTGRSGKTIGGTVHGRKRERIGGTFVPFSGAMHNDAMQNLLRIELKTPWHVHGMRATFRTWVSDNARSVKDHDAAEIQLDHVIGNKVSRSYDRADMLAERRELAERWAAHLTA